MWDLSKHEQLEMELLNGLNSIKVLAYLIFCGGTMLRLCHELNRYSVDLDFWLTPDNRAEEIHKDIRNYLRQNYTLRTSENTPASLLYEFAARGYARRLKIEIRKAPGTVKYEERIAFSKHSSLQVLVKAATLEEMMRAKIETFLNRAQIRDVFDIEFLVKKGVKIEASEKQLSQMRKQIKHFKLKDYKVTLGSLLAFKDRQYYKSANFKFLLSHIENL